MIFGEDLFLKDLLDYSVLDIHGYEDINLVYSPMMQHKMNQPGKSLGVIGLGGLGHIAVKFG